MTSVELRQVLSPVVIWMADAAIRTGIRAYHKAEREREKESKNQEEGKLYNFTLAHAYDDGLGIAAETLFRLFSSCVADCEKAIREIAKTHDGYVSQKYFDLFVEALEKVKGYPVSLRKSDWVLESL